MAVPVCGIGVPALEGLESSDILSGVLADWVHTLYGVVINCGYRVVSFGVIEKNQVYCQDWDKGGLGCLGMRPQD